MYFRILTMIATSGFLAARPIEYTKFVFGRDLPQIPLGELTALLHRHPSWFFYLNISGKGQNLLIYR